ncbi:MAG: DUF3572 domain-containing protein [Pseudomonadota bacterium]
MDAEHAETDALKLLGWLALQEELLPVFLGATGASLDDLRARASEPDFLASLVDFLLMDDAWVLQASDAMNWSPERIGQIRAGLPGGELPHWT